MKYGKFKLRKGQRKDKKIAYHVDEPCKCIQSRALNYGTLVNQVFHISQIQIQTHLTKRIIYIKTILYLYQDYKYKY